MSKLSSFGLRDSFVSRKYTKPPSELTESSLNKILIIAQMKPPTRSSKSFNQPLEAGTQLGSSRISTAEDPHLL